MEAATSFTSSGDISISKYYKDVRKIGMLTAEQEKELALKAQAGDSIALDKLVKANLRLVIKIARQYHFQGYTLSDLINEGNIGLIKAAQKFEPSKDCRFSTYAIWWIKQHVIQALNNHQRLIRVPVDKISQYNKLKKDTILLRNSLLREPTISELASYSNLAEEEVERIFQINSPTVSYHKTTNNAETPLLDLLEDKSNQIISQETKYALNSELDTVLGKLSKREKEVIEMYFGLNSQTPLPLEEISLQMGISKERIRQVKEKALRKLRQKDNYSSLAQFL